MTEEQAQKEETKVEIPEKFKPLVDQIDKLSALELSELVKSLEGHYGVSASAPVAVAAAGGGGGEAAAEEKSSFNVELTAAGDKKINVIKAVKDITVKGLKDAKELVDGAPKVVKENVSKAEADELKKKLEEAGATVTLKTLNYETPNLPYFWYTFLRVSFLASSKKACPNQSR